MDGHSSGHIDLATQTCPLDNQDTTSHTINYTLNSINMKHKISCNKKPSNSFVAVCFLSLFLSIQLTSVSLQKISQETLGALTNHSKENGDLESGIDSNSKSDSDIKPHHQNQNQARELKTQQKTEIPHNYLFFAELEQQEPEQQQQQHDGVSNETETLTDTKNQRANEIDSYELVQMYYSGFEGAQGKMTIAQVDRVATAARFRYAGYLALERHKYDSYQELRLSGGPEVNQELCLLQLADLNQRALVQSRERMQSKDINLYQLLDTFGQIPSGLTSSNIFWPGTYNRCTRAKIDTLNSVSLPSETHSISSFKIKGSANPQISPKLFGAPTGGRSMQTTRYCWASARFRSWKQVDEERYDRQAIKVGVCLPKACDSLNYKNKYELVESLIEHQNHKYVYKNEMKLIDLYCLPDEQSPLRSVFFSRRSSTVIILSGLWMSFLIYATIKSEIAARRGDKQHPLSSFSVLTNLRRLFDCSKREETQPTQATNKQEPLVKFEILDGFKVISSVSIIMAHTLMCIPLTSTNEQEAIHLISSPPFLIGNLLPAFAVNSFFAITGLLTSYFALKHHEKHPFITSPLSWLVLILRRYIRIMPTYIIMVAYLKYLAKFTGSGPFWDYGTTILAKRKKCEQESWLITLFMGSNFMHPLEQCIPSAWYLASDFQFLLITPIFLIALLKMPEFGRLLLKISICAGYLVGIVGIMLEKTENLIPIAKFGPDGFKTYITFLSASYTQPHHRVPAYLFALLAGHTLYRMEKKKLDESDKDGNKSDKKSCENLETNQMETSGEVKKAIEIAWSPMFKFYGKYMSLFCAWIVILITPFVARLLPLNELGGKITVAISMPTYHLLYAASVTVYILLASTGGGFAGVNRFLAAKFWKPLARLSLCVVLINIEVIDYINQATTNTMEFTGKALAQAQLVSLVLIYLAATFMYVTIEIPMKNFLEVSMRALKSCLVSSQKRRQE